MDESKKYQKLDLDAILEDVQKGHPKMNQLAIRQHANFFEIYTNEYRVDTDDVISISLILFGVHNALEIETPVGLGDYRPKGIALMGSVYHILPKYYVKGEIVTGADCLLKSSDQEYAAD